MTCSDFRILINREVDGRTSPEEEAHLMQHVAACAQCAKEQTLQHRMHQAFRAAPKVACPEGLAERIADAVLAPAGAKAPIHRFSASLFRQRMVQAAAVVLLTVGLAGFGGWMLARDGRDVKADPNQSTQRFTKEVEGWQELGVPADAASDIASIKADFEARRRAVSDRSKVSEIDEQEMLAVLEIVSRFPAAIERYQKKYGYTAEEMRKLKTTGRR